MKLKLHSLNIQQLRETLSLISQQRKFLVLRFTSAVLYVILVNEDALFQEPQVWCKLKMDSLFDDVEILSLNDNQVLLELNGELLLQTLRHFERANSDGLILRLQRMESASTSSSESHTDRGRTVSLTLFYSHRNDNDSIINHKFQIPARVLKNTHEIVSLKEPTLDNVDLIMNLPNGIVSTYKRLDKFKRNSANDLVTIKASRRGGGFLGFVFEEDGKFKVTISWNEKLDIRKPPSLPPEDSMINTFATRDLLGDSVDHNDESEDKHITVKLRDWKLASKIVANCKTVILLLAHEEACVLHCLLDDTDEVEIVFSINGLKLRNLVE